MLSRVSTLRHKDSGVSLRTPLLIPSFSSKGFGRSKRKGQSEIERILRTSSEFLTEACLLSAYDLHYGYLPPPESLPCKPDLLFLDSGGYEVSEDQDFSSVTTPSPPADPSWDVKSLKSVLDAWPNDLPAVFVSYDSPDSRYPLLEQVNNARELFKRRNQHLHLLLIKPETEDQASLNSALKNAIAHVDELGSFDVVGVTEKELGRSMLDRMVQISKLRLAMDDAGLIAPIHVFGALDPLSACLYYVSGAEIFDGLTWIRYAYHEGRCVYMHNHGVLKYGLHTSNDLVKSRAMSENYYELQKLQHRLREFHTTGDFEKLAPHGDFLKNAYDSLMTSLKGRL